MKPLLKACGAAVLSVLATTGCLFNVAHELPPNAYFGKLPESRGVTGRPLEDEGRKNWALIGLVSYSDWSTRDLLENASVAPDERVEGLSIETTFDTVDTIVWVFPGFLYGYYVWAPRTIRVEGTRVR